MWLELSNPSRTVIPMVYFNPIVFTDTLFVKNVYWNFNKRIEQILYHSESTRRARDNHVIWIQANSTLANSIILSENGKSKQII